MIATLLLFSYVGSFILPSHVNMDQGPALTMDDLSTEDRSTRQVTPVTSPTPQRKSASRSSSETSTNILDDPCRTLYQHAASSSLVSALYLSLSTLRKMLFMSPRFERTVKSRGSCLLCLDFCVIILYSITHLL